MRSRKKLATLMIIIGLILIIAGIVAIILLHSQSAEGPEVGLIGSDGEETGGVHIGGFSISTAALSIIVGGIIAIIGIFKGRKIQLNSDGTVIVN